MKAKAPYRKAPSRKTVSSTTRAQGFFSTSPNSAMVRRSMGPSALRVCRAAAGRPRLVDKSSAPITTNSSAMPMKGTRQLR